jgi:ABC-type Fe3+-siderophore transport system permease subunit
MTRPTSIVLMEAIIIGIMNAVLIYILSKLKMKMKMPIVYLLAGALIHIIFEYTGGNKWWCTQTYKL